jgi:hypothetical protein
LGTLLGVLIGLSASHVVSVAVTALVALLGGLFGLSEKVPVNFTVSGARRLTSFALAAAVFTPLATVARTHDWLLPSVPEQRRVLREIGYADNNPAQVEILRFLRFGLIPTNAVESKTRGIGGAGVLYADVSSALCDALARTATVEDLVVFLRADASTSKLADAIEKMPQKKRADAPEWVKTILCSGA